MKLIRSIYFYVLVAIVCITIGCKEEPIAPIVECGALPYCPSPLGYNYYYDLGSIGYYQPMFNPTNSNEIAYVRIYRSDGSTEYTTVEKFNIVTGQKNFVFSNQDLQTNLISPGRFDWAQNDWIVFENQNNTQLYKMKSNGSQLTQLTFDGFSNFPCFNFSGDRILFSNYSTTYGYYCLVEMDIASNAGMDTLTNFAYHRLGVLQNNLYVSSNPDDTVRIINGNTMTIANRFYPNFSTTAPNIIWGVQNISSDTDEVMVLSGFHGIFRLNLVTKDLQLVKASCENRVIESFSVSSDGFKIVYEVGVFDSPSSDPCSIRVQSEIHLMNIDGSNDQLLTLP